MSLSSFLLGKTKNVDSELDSLFKVSPPIRPAQAIEAAKHVDSASRPDKPTSSAAAEAPVAGVKAKKRKIAEAEAEVEVEAEAESSKAAETKKTKKAKLEKGETEKAKEKTKKEKKGKKAKASVVEPESDEENDDAALEDSYLAGKLSRDAVKPVSSKAKKEKKKKKQDESSAGEEDAVDVDEEDEEDASEEEEGDAAIPVHESVSGKRAGKSAKKQKVVPENETPEQRDRRTIFIGNLPLAVAEKRPLQKQLQKHILALVPTAKIEALRFRSVPFQAPTNKLEEEGAAPKPGAPATPSTSAAAAASTAKGKPQPRQHDLDRTSSWRSSHPRDKADESSLKADEKRYLTPNQKKRIAFINGEFHTSAAADSVNCYAVFAFPPDQSKRPSNLPPLPETMDPYEAARAAVERCNGTVFMERVVRVDMVGERSKDAVARRKGDEGGEDVEDEQKPSGALLDADPKLSIFVGNLDFESKEEDLRVFFETLIKAEKGEREGEEEKVVVEGAVIKKPATWVKHVRIIRDKDTQLGKGFAYVQFAEKDCVDEVLAMDGAKIKFAKRKLRVQRCKSVPGSKTKIKSVPPPAPKASNAGGAHTAARGVNATPVFRQRPTPIAIPKGDPMLGERLVNLSKEDRKQAKSVDADRVARRLAKKKARMAMGPPSKAAGGPGAGGKERQRERKGPGAVKARAKTGSNPGRKAGKVRTRSDKFVAKKNTKKV